MTKKERFFRIRKIITAGAVGSQEELRRQLEGQGCRVTQATLSRDLKDLGASWVAGPDGGHYSLPASGDSPALRPLMGAGVLDIAANETLVLVRTLPGAAGTVAEFIDSQRLQDVLGTVAGDNTVLVIPSSIRKLGALQKLLKEKLLAA
ncbi:MAG: arginine repressor [Elusimicrobiota bacterium]|nr:arginine repressor [Elusimicrobiota bacterium]